MIIGKPQTRIRSTYVARCILSLIALVTVGVAARAQQPATAPAPAHATAAPLVAAAAPKHVSEEAETPVPKDTGHQGIHVHGHWVLQVKNPDGTLGERREFENSLTTGSVYTTTGDDLLVGLLSGNIVPGDPGIVLVQWPDAATTTSDAAIYSGVICYGETIYCSIISTSHSFLTNAPAINTMSQLSIQTGITVQASFGAGTAHSTYWLISANFTVPSGQTQIGGVQTGFTYCAPGAASYFGNGQGLTNSVLSFTVVNSGRNGDISPHACDTSNTTTLQGSSGSEGVAMAVLTATVLTSAGAVSPLTVTPGSIVQVSVKISFS